MDMMMCGGNIFRSVKGVGIVEILHTHTHTHTHTPISVAEKIFKVSFREAMNESSWSRFLCDERLWIATPLARNDGWIGIIMEYL